MLEKAQKHLAFYSLIRTFAAEIHRSDEETGDYSSRRYQGGVAACVLRTLLFGDCGMDGAA